MCLWSPERLGLCPAGTQRGLRQLAGTLCWLRALYPEDMNEIESRLQRIKDYRRVIGNGGLPNGPADIQWFIDTVDKLNQAIITHHSQKADDRCVEDDDRLYEAAGLPPCDRRVGSKEEMIKNCIRFIERRCKQGYWPTYAELENRLSKLRKALEWYACTHRPEDYLNDGGEIALRALEEEFPNQAGQAFAEAREEVLASGQSVLQTEGDSIFEVFPDGRKVFVKKIPT